MRFIKKSQRTDSKVGLVLLDWSVRESFHLFHYLSQQTVPRGDFEVIVVEYYDRVSPHIKEFEDQVDTWLVLDTPKECYYHKHLMYNAGIVVANSDIIMIGDSDAMVKPSFIDTIIKKFEKNPEIVYHIDQFRNVRRDFYPFNYPSFEDVMGDGCVNNAGGVTAGVLEQEDPIHSRNYGACMCAMRKDLIDIGGADMHIDYLGHVCGPYDLTFRLINHGRREIWDMNEFMYHTWHPGQAGADNYVGPHDGRHMSTTALEALSSGRVTPFLENPAIRALREGKSREQALAELYADHYVADWNINVVYGRGAEERWAKYLRPLGTYKGFRLVSEAGRVFAFPLSEREAERQFGEGQRAPIEGGTVDDVRDKIDDGTPRSLNFLTGTGIAWAVCRRAWDSFVFRVGNLPLPMSRTLKVVLAVPLIPLGLIAMILFRGPRLVARVAAVAETLTSGDPGRWHLPVTLYNLKKWGCIAAKEQVVLVVPREGMRRFVSLLQRLGIVPAIDIEVAGSADQFSAVISRLDHDTAVRKLLLPADLNSRFRSTVAASKVGKFCLVL